MLFCHISASVELIDLVKNPTIMSGKNNNFKSSENRSKLCLKYYIKSLQYHWETILPSWFGLITSEMTLAEEKLTDTSKRAIEIADMLMKLMCSCN